jgi:hypothetical protein
MKFLVIPSLILLVAGAAQATPTGVVGNLEWRVGAASIAGVTSTTQVLPSLAVGNYGAGGSFSVTQPLEATTFPFWLNIPGFPGGGYIGTGSFGPGLVGSGFGGTAPIGTVNGTFDFEDPLGVVNIVARSLPAIRTAFGRSGSGVFAHSGYTVGFWQRGAWTTRTVTLSGLHPGASGGAFVTQLAGYDHRNASGVGRLSLVSPLLVTDVDAIFSPPPAPTYSYPFFAVLNLEFVPEPATAVLALAGLGAFAVAMRRRQA